MEFTVPMALADFVPVFLFLVASIILQRDLYNKMSKGAFALFSAGTINIFVAGFLKALYKLLYAANVCNFEKLNVMFFPSQSLGFALAALGLVAMLFHKQGEGKSYSVAPAVYSGTGIFIGMMVVGLGTMDAVLAVLAKKLNKKSAMIVFAVSFICSLCMGYLGTRDFSKAIFNWIGELVNIGAMLTFLIGTLMLHKAGLKDLEM